MLRPFTIPAGQTFALSVALGLAYNAALTAGSIPKPTAHKTIRATHRTPPALTRPLSRKRVLSSPRPHIPATADGLKPVPLLPNPPMTIPYVIPPLLIYRVPSLNTQPQTYGGGGGNVILPSGGSFGGPPIAGGSFGGGQRTGGSFGNGRVY